MQVVADFFTQENITKFPVNPFQIIKRNGWELFSYSELAQMHNRPIQDVINAWQTEDGCVIRYGKTYRIVYNDTIDNPKRIRFTLMHEIGHILLNHLIEFKETTFMRGGLTAAEYKVLEREAHAFARNVLCPPFVLGSLKKLIVSDISDCFMISPAATKTRLQMLDWDSRYMLEHDLLLSNRFESYIDTMINSKQCLKCGNQHISKIAKYCPVCGHQRFGKIGRANELIYEGFVLDETSRPLICPRCENEQINEQDNHCKICALTLVNKCAKVDTDYNGDEYYTCNTLADGNARFCIACGHPTTYAESGLLKSWGEEFEEKRKMNNLEVVTGYSTKRMEL